MNVTMLRSAPAYRAMIAAPPEKRDEIYRFRLMAPFKKKWDCYPVPMRPSQAGGYDVVMASSMLGIAAPTTIDGRWERYVSLLDQDDLWDRCTCAMERSLALFTGQGIGLPVKDYVATLLLADPDNPSVVANEGYCGDGGIPGYVLAWLVPTPETMARMPAALAHEINHNVRFQFIAWRGDITLAEMMVSEGLAENFAVHLFGSECAGPWVSRTDAATLAAIKPALRQNSTVHGLDNLSAYLFGDEIAALQGYPQAGMPYCAGYACGYHLVRHFLDTTGIGIVEATLLPADTILEASEGFWGI